MHPADSSVPTLTVTELTSPAAPQRVLVLVPGLGTDLRSTWSRLTPHLDPGTHALGIELPGHGASAPWDPAPEAPAMEHLAEGVIRAVHRFRAGRPDLAEVPVHLAGISLAGGLALQLAIDHQDVFTSTVVVCSAAIIGEPQAWRDRAALVLEEGTGTLSEGSAQRWFAPGFRESDPGTTGLALAALRETDDASYAALCSVLSRFDVRDRLSEVSVPVLVVSGEHDPVTPPTDGAAVASAMPHGRAEVVTGVSHQAPTERPAEVAALMDGFLC